MEHFLTTILDERPMIGLLLAFTVLALLSCIPFLPIPLVVGMIATQFEWYVAWAVSITGVSLIAFCSATIIGKAPNMFVYAAAGSELQHNPVLISVFVAVYIVLLLWMARLVKTKLPQL